MVHFSSERSSAVELASASSPFLSNNSFRNHSSQISSNSPFNITYFLSIKLRRKNYQHSMSAIHGVKEDHIPLIYILNEFLKIKAIPALEYELYEVWQGLNGEINDHRLFSIVLSKITAWHRSSKISNIIDKEHERQRNIVHVYMIQRAKKYILDHISMHITIQNIASHCYASKYHFCRLFKSYTGFTIIQYIKCIRLKKAEALLLQTDLPLKEICNECGYKRVDYFSSDFKKRFKCAPLAYRKSRSHRT